MGNRIKSRRKELNLTQEEMAELLNISVKHLSEVERGLAGLSIENLIKLSDILCVSIDYIVKGEQNKNDCPYDLSKAKMIPKEKEMLFQNLINIGAELSR